MSIRGTTIRICGAAIVWAGALAAGPVWAKDDPAVAAEVMSLARAQWSAEIAGKGAADQMVAVADDYTEFNADFPTLVVGKAMASQMLSVPQSSTPMYSDMQNPRVQVYGDTAILTYNFAGINKGSDGKIAPSTAKSTRVYVRQGGKWMLVHANFAPVSAGN
jgi:ketosteroid isomerase-like protein